MIWMRLPVETKYNPTTHNQKWNYKTTYIKSIWSYFELIREKGTKTQQNHITGPSEKAINNFFSIYKYTQTCRIESLHTIIQSYQFSNYERKVQDHHSKFTAKIWNTLFYKRSQEKQQTMANACTVIDVSR